MKKYKVNVNGTVYEVTVEPMDGAAPAAAAPAAAPAPAPAAARPSSPTVFFFIQKPPVICFFSIYYPDRPSVNRECENPRKNLPPERGRATPPG